MVTPSGDPEGLEEIRVALRDAVEIAAGESEVYRSELTRLLAGYYTLAIDDTDVQNLALSRGYKRGTAQTALTILVCKYEWRCDPGFVSNLYTIENFYEYELDQIVSHLIEFEMAMDQGDPTLIGFL